MLKYIVNAANTKTKESENCPWILTVTDARDRKLRAEPQLFQVGGGESSIVSDHHEREETKKRKNIRDAIRAYE